jgi:hypothetical protein
MNLIKMPNKLKIILLSLTIIPGLSWKPVILKIQKALNNLLCIIKLKLNSIKCRKIK